VDDHFDLADENDTLWYEPYKKLMPSGQVTLLQLWDELGIPHAEAKQVSGPVLRIIGFDIDPNAMTVSMSLDKRAKLVAACKPFTVPGARLPLRDFWALEGHINWALNVYPLLRPCLSAMYEKTAGKTLPRALLRVNTAIARELSWFTAHVEASSGVHIMGAAEWTVHDQVDTLEVYTDASGIGLGVWFPSEHAGYQYALPPGENAERRIFFWEAVAACSALHLSRLHGKPRRILCHTDNTNTFDIFHSLRAKPSHNTILISAVDALIADGVDLRVTWIPTEDNMVADALSRLRNDLATCLSPGLKITSFQPPRDALGAGKK
jgi:hypothetical protein